MVRFARAKGSKASNLKLPNEPTPWHVMKEQLEITQKAKEEIQHQRKTAKELLREKDEPYYPATLNTNTDWAEFEDKSSKKNQPLHLVKNGKIKKGIKSPVKVKTNSENQPTANKEIKNEEKEIDKEVKEIKKEVKEEPNANSKSEATVDEGKKKQNHNTETQNKNDGAEKSQNEPYGSFSQPNSELTASTKRRLRRMRMQEKKNSENQDKGEANLKRKSDDLESPENKKPKVESNNEFGSNENSIPKLSKTAKRRLKRLRKLEELKSNEAKTDSTEKEGIKSEKAETAEKTEKAEKPEVKVLTKRQKRNLKNRKEEVENGNKKLKTNEDGNKFPKNRNGKFERQESNMNGPMRQNGKMPRHNHNKPGKIRDDKEHPRRKPENDYEKMIINGIEVEIVRYDGFPVRKEDAERLKELRQQMVIKGVPKAEIDHAMKLERRKAEKALTRIKKQVCFLCRKAGHNLSDCPNLDKEQSSVGVCFKCGSTEHTHFECKVNKTEDFRFAKCFICREQGHIAKQCPDNPKGLYPKGGSCNVCGDVTHLKKDCPDLMKKKEETAVTVTTIANDKLECLDEDLVKKNEKPKETKQKVVTF